MINKNSIQSDKKRVSARNPGDVVSGAQDMLKKLAEKDKEVTEEEIVDEPKSAAKLSSLANIKDLLFLGRLSKEVEIGDYVFEVSTLKNSEFKEAVSELSKLEMSERPMFTKQYTLAKAIRKINNIAFDEVCD